MSRREITALIIRVTFLVALQAMLLSLSVVSADEVTEDWQTIFMSGQRIGYAQSTSFKKKVEGEERFVTDTLMVMKLSRFGQELTIRQKTHSEDLSDGTLLSFHAVMENPPNSRTVMSGEIENGTLTMTSTVGGKSTFKTLSGLSNVRSSQYSERYIATGKLADEKTVEFQIFEPQLGIAVPVTLTYQGKVKAGENQGLHEVQIEQELPGAGALLTSAFCEDDWSITKMVVPLMNMEVRTATQAEALEPIGDQEFDFALDTMVPVQGAGAVRHQKSVTYRITIDGSGDESVFSETDFQKSKPSEDQSFLLMVTKPILEENQQATEINAQELQICLRPSKYIESGLPLIQSLADEHGNGKDAVEVALSLERFVGEYVSEKNFSTAMATAGEVARSKAGDCTEHAVLLAALLRAKKIPARVVIGFVYSPQHQAFVGHMWTEAVLNGRWFPLDGTRGRGGIDPGYLTIASSSLSDQSASPAVHFLPMLHLLGRTQIEVVSAKSSS